MSARTAFDNLLAQILHRKNVAKQIKLIPEEDIERPILTELLDSHTFVVQDAETLQKKVMSNPVSKRHNHHFMRFH